jgi:iron complex transport system substrate-binding protein
LGECRVPRQPRRIVSLSSAATDSLVALGMRPVLVESAWKSAAAAPYLAGGLQGTAAVRRAGGISLEAVLDAQPDLILAGSTQDARNYELLSRIAPTVVLETALAGSRETILLDVGDVLGVPQRARGRLAEYRRRCAQAKAALAESARNEPVVFLRFRQHTCVIYAQTQMFGPLLFEQLGLRPDAAMPRSMSPGGWDVLSLERLSTLRPAHIFAVVDSDSAAYYAYVAATPIWKAIPAVRNGRVHRVAASTWLGGEGILANEAIIEDVLAAMIPGRRP